MALRNLTANLAERLIPTIQNNQTFSMVDAYSKYTPVSYKASKGFAPIDTSDKTLQVIYDDYKKDNKVLSPLYREVGNSYKKPYLLSRALVDTERITRFLASPPGGLFLLEQTGLQLSQPKSHFVTAQGTRFFNPVQFLANIPGRAVGLHVQNHGLIGISKNYEQVTNAANTIDAWLGSGGNRLVNVWRELGYDEKYKNVTTNTKIDDFLDKIRGAVIKVKKFLGVNYSGKVIKEYSGLGGPKSLFGVGYTDIRSYSVGIQVSDANDYSIYSTYRDKYTDSSYSELSRLKTLYYGGGNEVLPSINEQPGNTSATRTVSGFGLGNIFTSKELSRYNDYQATERMATKHSKNYNTKENNYPSVKSETFNDFRKKTKVDYNTENIHRRTGIPNTGDTDPIYENENNNNQNDLIALKFTYAGEDTPLQFRATISSLSNTFSPEWNSVDYVGRPDSVYTYKGVKRAISFSFIIAAGSEKEMDTIYRKLNKLSNMTAPSYSNNGSESFHMIGPVVKLKIGNYINSEPGYISSLTFNIDDDFIWDVTREEPMYIKVDVSFDVIGRETTRRGISYFGREAK